MLIEKQFQTRLSATLCFISASIMLLLAIQNYRYGLYDLIYAASILSTSFLVTGLYARFAPEAKYYKLVLLSSVIFAYLVIVFFSSDHAVEIKHWLFPVTLLSYLSLSQNHANIAAASVGALFTIVLLFTETFTDAFAFSAAYALFVGLTATYAQLHQKRSRTLVELEIHDPLTRAYNYRHLEDTLKKEICRADRTGRPLSLIALEIDYFPQIQSTHGTNACQELLQRFTETLRAMIRAGDSDYFDGKQTAYLLLPCTPSEGLLVIAERIRRTIEESNWPTVDAITVSLGCSAYISESNSIDREHEASQLINNTHLALVEAQKNGHNRVCLHAH